MRDDLQPRIASLLPPIREHLLAGVLAFTQAARRVPGVTRIALIGSLATDKPDPKDADVLVTVADDADLTQLTAHGRKLQGHAQSRNCGEVFLADRRGAYLGRTCPWKDCPPCDLLIIHQDEVEAELAAIFARRAPELVGNSYLALGTLDCDVWKRGVAEPLPIQEMLEHLHDFAEVLELRRAST